jgi:hypothetical protein
MALRFDDRTGRLIHEAPPSSTVLMPWPVMAAFRSARPGASWVACLPPFALVPEMDDARSRAAAGPLVDPADREGLAELRKYCSLVPADLRAAVGAFPERHWHLLAWLAHGGPAAEQLLASNPALAFALASGTELTAIDTPVNFARRQMLMAYHPQRDLLARLGFPPSERVRRILLKVPPRLVTFARIGQLARWLADRGICERLAHVPAINLAVLRVLEEGTLAHLTPAALDRLARAEDETEADHHARRLAEVVRLWGLVRPTVALPQFGGVARIDHEHALVQADLALIDRAAREHEAGRALAAIAARPDPPAPERRVVAVPGEPRRPGGFPAPPVPGTASIVPITTPAMLAEEGRIQKNCAADYMGQAERGTLAFYRVLAPQRCTLSLKKRRGRWDVDQLKGACNASPSTAVAQAVTLWLHQSRLATEPEPAATRARRARRRDGQDDLEL